VRAGFAGGVVIVTSGWFGGRKVISTEHRASETVNYCKGLATASQMRSGVLSFSPVQQDAAEAKQTSDQADEPRPWRIDGGREPQASEDSEATGDVTNDPRPGLRYEGEHQGYWPKPNNN
jgi:hypothetical protein